MGSDLSSRVARLSTPSHMAHKDPMPSSKGHVPSSKGSKPSSEGPMPSSNVRQGSPPAAHLDGRSARGRVPPVLARPVLGLRSVCVWGHGLTGDHEQHTIQFTTMLYGDTVIRCNYTVIRLCPGTPRPWQSYSKYAARVMLPAVNI